jgi:GT2 family glycosyltransferase
MRHIKKLPTRIGNKGMIVTNKPINKPVEQKAIISVSKVEIPSPVINILTRTSGRPNGFKRCSDSIKNQTYKNFRHLVSIDSLADEEYVKSSGAEYFFMNKEGISKEPTIVDPKTGPKFIYNLYLNKLIDNVKEGWVIFLDDDDYFSDANVLQKIVNVIKSNTDMILWQMKYPNGSILPTIQEIGKVPRMARIGAPCFAVHSGIAKTIKWDGWKCGDFRFIQKAWSKTVDKRVLKEALVSLGGAGLGKRLDINESAKINSMVNKGRNDGAEINTFGVIARLNKVAQEVQAAKEYYDFIIITSTYQRNEMLKSILEEINSQETDFSYKIIVLNDGNNVEEFNTYFSEVENVKILHNNKNNGKYEYWKSIDTLFKEANKYNFKYLIQLDDDSYPVQNFLNTVVEFFNKNNNTILKLMVTENHNFNSKMEVNKKWGMNHWVDGGTAYPKIIFDTIGYRINEIPKSRWYKAEWLGSGVWEQVSKRFNKHNFKTYNPPKSYLNHLGYKDSIMNSEERKKRNLKSIM